jgi:glycosyltransferase involved in cell wall biosynthesis
LRDADVLLHPAMHDSAPWAVAEAATLGCRILCLDRGGPPVIAEPFGGHAVPSDQRAAASLAHHLMAFESAQAALDVRDRSRWSSERVAETVTGWYKMALGEAAAVDEANSVRR